jgi:hypothetical protein
VSNLDPIMQEALAAANPDWQKTARVVEETTSSLKSLERTEIQRVIESLITLLHPDGYEASEILAALTDSVTRRYDNQMICYARIEEYSRDLQKWMERAHDAS